MSKCCDCCDEVKRLRAELAQRDEMAAGHPAMCCGQCHAAIKQAEAQLEKVVEACSEDFSNYGEAEILAKRILALAAAQLKEEKK